MPRKTTRYYAATDGRITVWRATMVRFYRSVLISEFGRARFRACLPSGEANCHPVVQITQQQFRALADARGSGSESWLDNADVPAEAKVPVQPAIPQGWMEIEAGLEVMIDAVDELAAEGGMYRGLVAT